MSKVLKRENVDERLTWDLTPIFKTDEEWEKEYENLKNEISKIREYEEIMLNSANELKETLNLSEELEKRISKLYVYAHLKSDEDTTNSKYQSFNSKAMNLYSEYSSYSTFIPIKLLEADENKLKQYLEEKGLEEYKFDIEKLLHSKKHTLSQKEEELLANLSQLISNPSKTFSLLNNADLKFDDVLNEKGEKLPLTHSLYGVYMDSEDRTLRKNSYNSMYKSYKSFRNTFASTLEGSTRAHVIKAKLKKYSSARQAALSANFIDEKVYDSLVEAVNERLPLLHRYMELRKKALKVDELHMYDMGVSLVENVDLKYSIEEAKEIVFEALKPMGEDYLSILKKSFDERWIDFVANEGKRSGAYSSGTYGTNPYILISWQNTMDNLYTLVHELGHSIHSYYTRNNQSYIYGNYTIFLAEVASITNEMLLTDYLLKKYENDKNIKAYLLCNYLDRVRATLYRQTQFAEYEAEIHKMMEKDIPLTADVLSKKYYEINEKYYGKVVTFDENISYEWARIPHFYYNFYVYQYATGISAAAAFSKKILEEGKEAVDKYIEYLKSGSSDYSLNILKKAGVDMSTNKPVFDALDNFETRLIELEKLLEGK